MTREEMKHYQHDWHQRNKERIRERMTATNREYYQRNREAIRERKRKDYREHYEEIRAKRLAYEEEHREDILKVKNNRSKIYRLDLKFDAITAYGGECAICGESYIECLTLDHSKNDGAKFRKEYPKLHGGPTFYLWLRQRGFPQDLGLRVLCWNCNCSIGAFGYSPYEREIT